MKSKKTIDELEIYCESTMRWGSGEVVCAYLSWDELKYYLWFEPTIGFEELCEEVLEREHDDSMMKLLDELRAELANIGVQEFYDLVSVNEYCEGKCGSNDPYDRAEFYVDDWGSICGA